MLTAALSIKQALIAWENKERGVCVNWNSSAQDISLEQKEWGR